MPPTVTRLKYPEHAAIGRRASAHLIKMNFLFILSTQKTDADDEDSSSNSFPIRVSEIVYRKLADGKVGNFEVIS